MRSLLDTILVAARDSATQVVAAGAFVETQDDANSLQSDLEAIYTPPNFEVSQQRYWVGLNKNIIIQFLTLGIPTGVLNMPALMTEKPEFWNTKSDGFEPSARINGEMPTIRPPVTAFQGAHISLLRFLGFLQAQMTERGLAQEASQLHQLALNYDAGRITPGEVYGRVAAIV